jgi:hypothetical protein
MYLVMVHLFEIQVDVSSSSISISKDNQVEEITFQSLLSPSDLLGFIVEWVKYKYGVFDEFGSHNDPMYPKFYRQGLIAVPTSCANIALAGNFSQDCMESGDCPFQDGQVAVTSSFLYSQNQTLFPNVNWLNSTIIAFKLE